MIGVVSKRVYKERMSSRTSSFGVAKQIEPRKLPLTGESIKSSIKAPRGVYRPLGMAHKPVGECGAKKRAKLNRWLPSDICLDTVRSDLFPRLFPGHELKQDKDTKSNFRVQKRILHADGMTCPLLR